MNKNDINLGRMHYKEWIFSLSVEVQLANNKWWDRTRKNPFFGKHIHSPYDIVHVDGLHPLWSGIGHLPLSSNSQQLSAFILMLLSTSVLEYHCVQGQQNPTARNGGGRHCKWFSISLLLYCYMQSQQTQSSFKLEVN